MIRPIRVTAPTDRPVSVEDVRMNSYVDHYDDDPLLDVLIDAAVSHLDGYTGTLGRCMVNQSWRQDYHDWAWRFRLPFPDVSSVTITYQDTDNATQTVSSDDYEIIDDAQGSAVVFRDTFLEPSLYGDMVAPITVTMTVGYGTAADVPEPLKAAIKLMVGHWYHNREATGSAEALPYGFDMLIAPYRRGVV